MKKVRTKNNYHPIAVLSCISKILSKIICRSLCEYCVSHQLRIRNNLGFKRNDSTVNQRLSITHNIYKSLDSGKKTYVVFFWMCQKLLIGLIFTLRQFGITDTFHCWNLPK